MQNKIKKLLLSAHWITTKQNYIKKKSSIESKDVALCKREQSNCKGNHVELLLFNAMYRCNYVVVSQALINIVKRLLIKTNFVKINICLLL
jgi:hypothetical protein